MRCFYTQMLEILVFLSLPIWYFLTKWKKNSPVGTGTCPVLLVHGYINAGFVWDFHKKFLSQQGIGPIYTIDLGNSFTSICTLANRLQHKVDSILQETGQKELVLVGHSMGGLVSAYYALKIAPQGTVRSVITLGSPLYGTKMARLGIGLSAKEMRIGSEFLKQLHELYMTKEGLSFYHVVTKLDAIVVPYLSGIFVGNCRNSLVVKNLGHVSLLISKEVASYVANVIARK